MFDAFSAIVIVQTQVGNRTKYAIRCFVVPELFIVNLKALRKSVPQGLLLLIGRRGTILFLNIAELYLSPKVCVSIRNWMISSIKPYDTLEQTVSIFLRFYRKNAIKNGINFMTLCSIYTTIIYLLINLYEHAISSYLHLSQ